MDQNLENFVYDMMDKLGGGNIHHEKAYFAFSKDAPQEGEILQCYRFNPALSELAVSRVKTSPVRFADRILDDVYSVQTKSGSYYLVKVGFEEQPSVYFARTSSLPQIDSQMSCQRLQGRRFVGGAKRLLWTDASTSDVIGIEKILYTQWYAVLTLSGTTYLCTITPGSS